MGHEAGAIAILNNLSTGLPPDRLGDQAHIIYLILIPIPLSFLNINLLCPLGLSDYCLISVSIPFCNPFQSPTADEHFGVMTRPIEVVFVIC